MLKRVCFKLPSDLENDDTDNPDYPNVNVTTLEFTWPHSIGVEHVAYETLKQLQL